MPSTNELLFDASVRHSIGIERYKVHITQRVRAVLERSHHDLADQIARRLVLISERGFDTSPSTSRRLQRIFEQIGASSEEARKIVHDHLRGELIDLARDEAAFASGSLQRALPIAVQTVAIPAAYLRAIVTSRPLHGRHLRDWLTSFSRQQRSNLHRAIQTGLIEGQSTEAIVRRIRGTRRAGFRDGILETSRRSAEAIARTAVSHVSNRAREAVYGENADLIKGVMWVSTLDGRTSWVCIQRDGTIFPPNKGARPPGHPACRSSTVPITKSWRQLGIDADDLDPGTRASMNGQTPSTETYPTWLRRQPREVVEEALGVKKARLFLDGQLSIDRFTDRDLRPLTLEELRRREAEAWSRAGLDGQEAA